MIFEVTDKDPKVTLELGEPLNTTAAVRKQGTVFYFTDPSLIGRHGERIILTRNNAMPSAPKLTVKNGDGSYNREVQFRVWLRRHMFALMAGAQKRKRPLHSNGRDGWPIQGATQTCQGTPENNRLISLL